MNREATDREMDDDAQLAFERHGMGVRYAEATLQQGYLPSIAKALRQWRLAVLIALANIAEIRRTSRIALISPFINILLLTAVIGYVYGAMPNVDKSRYVAQLALSLAVWQLIANFITVSATFNDMAHHHLSFSAMSPYTLPLSGLIEALLYGLSRLTAAVGVATVALREPTILLGLPAAFAGLIVLAAALFFCGIVTGYLLDRIRPLNALAPQLLFVGFLVTPIIWQPEMFPETWWIAAFNPLHHAIEVIRAPLSGQGTPWLSLSVTAAAALMFAVLGAFTHAPNRQLIAFRWTA